VQCTCIVKTIPTNEAVRRLTPSDRGPISSSCCKVFRTWTLPVMDLITTCNWPAIVSISSSLQFNLSNSGILCCNWKERCSKETTLPWLPSNGWPWETSHANLSRSFQCREPLHRLMLQKEDEKERRWKIVPEIGE
jgi:hypothetical protein